MLERFVIAFKIKLLPREWIDRASDQGQRLVILPDVKEHVVDAEPYGEK